MTRFSITAASGIQLNSVLKRVHAHTPARGEIAIFNRSHYEDVLVVRVHDLVPESVWKARYDHINHWENLLADEGTVILKFFLHISRKEQKARLEARLNDPEKMWKFSSTDVEERQYWPAYQEAYEYLLAKCSTKQAPWYVVPADSKPHRDLFIANLLVQTLARLELPLPKPTFAIDKVKLD
jgi:PPK2 family polyphosphate:nucleotide phosphotransferase